MRLKAYGDETTYLEKIEAYIVEIENGAGSCDVILDDLAEYSAEYLDDTFQDEKPMLEQICCYLENIKT